MKRPKAGWLAGLEVLGLVLGVGLLMYVACGEEEPASPRESRVFAAVREPGAATPSERERRRVIDQLLAELLGGIATGQLQEQQRAEVQQRLVAALEAYAIGSPEHHASAAGLIVQQMFDQAKRQSGRRDMTARQALAVSGMARELSRQLIAVASGASPGADGVEAHLPAGHERLDWDRLGSFAYREGAPLPADVLELDGHRVGLPGFMLTLGEGRGAREFVLVESLWGCCFGGVPEMNQTVLVRMRADERLKYTAGPLLVTGMLDVGEQREGGFVTSLYRIEGASVSSLDPAR